MQHETMTPEAATEARAIVTLSGPAVRDAVKLLASKLIDRRNTVPLWGAIHFDVTPDGRAILTGTDCDIWASVTLSAESGDMFEPGAFCLDAAALHKLLSKAGKLERVRFTDTGDRRVILKAGRGEYKLPSLKVDEFPLVPISAFEAKHGGKVDRAQFLADLAALSPAISTEETRFYLRGVALQVRELGGRERFAMTATDGYMMAVASRDLTPGFEGWGAAMLPRKAVAFTLAADKLAGAGDLTLSRSGAHIAVECGALRMVSKLGEGTYPDWPRAFEHLCTPTDGEQGALFPELLPEWPMARTEALQKAATGVIEWRGANGGVIGECASDPGMMWAANYLFGNPATGRAYDEKLTVEVAGDREYLVPTTGAKIGLSKEQVAALCGDELWNVLELPSTNGRPRYVSAWCYEQGDSRLLCVGKDGRTPKAGAVREYVTREQVAAALAGGAIGEVSPVIEAVAPTAIARDAVAQYVGEVGDGGRGAAATSPEGTHTRVQIPPVADTPASAPETALPCDAEPAPATHAAPMPEIAPAAAPVAAEAASAPLSDWQAMAARGARLGVTQGDEESNGEFRARIEALEAALPVAPARPKRTPAHERAVRRAWAEQKARREAERLSEGRHATMMNALGTLHRLKAEMEQLRAQYDNAAEARTTFLRGMNEAGERERVAMLKRRRAVLAALAARKRTRHFIAQMLAEYDRRTLAEHEAREALAMRDGMRTQLAAWERRAEAAEAENAELWAEIDKLTAPATPIHAGAIPVQAGAA